MKSFLSVVILMFSAIVWGQTGTIEGVLSDKEVNNEPLPFANVVIKGTTKGATTDFDGKYIIENILFRLIQVDVNAGWENLFNNDLS